MTPEERQEQIEAYLDGRMSPAERLRFEEALALDPGLASELALHQELHQTFSDPAWLERRRQLAGLTEDFREPLRQTNTRWRWRWLWPLLAVGLGLLALWWLRQGRTEAEPTTTNTESPVSDYETPPALPTDTVNTWESSPVPAPPASDPFRPHPELEEAVSRPPDPSTPVSQATLEWEATNSGDRGLLRFRAMLESAEDPPTLELHLRNNRLDNRRPLQRLSIQVSPLADPPVRAFATKKEWQLQAEEVIRLTPGRFYGSLVRGDDGRIIWTGKLEVKGG